MTFWVRLEATRDRWKIADHPFYQRFIAGECTSEDLVLFAGQGAAPIRALAAAAEKVKRRAGSARRAKGDALVLEYRAQEAQWKQFERTVGISGTCSLLPESRECVATFSDDASRGPAVMLAVICAVERVRPTHAVAALDALDHFYDVDRESEGAAYFRSLADPGRRSARLGRALLEPLLETADQDGLLAHAEAALSSYWEMYDAMEREVSGAKPRPGRFDLDRSRDLATWLHQAGSRSRSGAPRRSLQRVRF